MLTQKDLDRTQVLIDNGALPKGNIYEIEAIFANQEQQIIAMENALTISKITLAQLLAIKDYQNFDIGLMNSFDLS